MTQPNLSERIATEVGERIIRGELAAGTRLLELQLAAELGVSRGPLREALRVLEKRRLIRILPRRGALVTDFEADDIARLYEVMVPLYQVLTRNTALRWTPEQLTPIYTVVERLIGAANAGDVEGYYEHNFTFARACAPVADNPLLLELLDDLEPSLRRVLYLSREARAAAMPDHLALLRKTMQFVVEREAERAAGMIAELGKLEQALALKAIEQSRELT